MTDEPTPGGNRRIDQILTPGFADDLPSLEMDELRRRRDLCRAEREYLSLLRRLLQGRRDLLRDEKERRRGGGAPGSVVERVTAVLADAPRGGTRGEVPVLDVPAEEIALARRRVERLLSDARLSDLESLGDQELEDAIERMDEEERGVSGTRAEILAALNALQEELKDRLRTQLKDLRA